MLVIGTIVILAFIAFCYKAIDWYVDKLGDSFLSLFLSLATFFVPIAIAIQLCEWILK